MGIHSGDRQDPNWLAVWWGRRFEYRQQIELAVIDMYDRYGAAAYGIARNSARARGGAEHRRVWGLVARRRRPHAGVPSGPPVGGRAGCGGALVPAWCLSPNSVTLSSPAQLAWRTSGRRRTVECRCASLSLADASVLLQTCSAVQ